MTALKRISVFTFLLLLQLSLYCQVQMGYKRILKPDYCQKDSAMARNLIGRTVKIWHEGGIYSSINLGDKYKWPTEEIRLKGGMSGWGAYKPAAGDTGIITHLFKNNGSVNNYIYLLKIGNNYVPLGCYYVTDPDLPDIHTQSVQDWIRDSITNVQYAAGCKFKIRNVNNQWSRAGITKLDILSEEFACSLFDQGVDTVLLCKLIFDNGALPAEKAFILWLDKGQGFVKAFFNNEMHEPTANKSAPFNTGSLISHFFENRLDTITTDPQSAIYISHSLGYSIQLSVPGYFFRERLTNFIIYQDQTHPKSIWWNKISETLGIIKKE